LGVANSRCAALWFAHDHAVLDVPEGRPALFRAPPGKIGPAKQNDGIGRRLARRFRSAERAGRDHFRLRTVRVMHVPFAARQHRRVGVTDRRVLRCGQQVEGAARDGGGQKKKDPLIRFHRGHSEVFIALILIRPATEALERHARGIAGMATSPGQLWQHPTSNIQRRISNGSANLRSLRRWKFV